MARPTKYDKVLHDAICRSLRAGMSRTTAAESNGIDKETIARWIDRYPAFCADVRESIGQAKARATDTITKAIREGDVGAAFRYLALAERDEWGAAPVDVNLRHSGAVGHVHRKERLAAALSPEELDALSTMKRKLTTSKVGR